MQIVLKDCSVFMIIIAFWCCLKKANGLKDFQNEKDLIIYIKSSNKNLKLQK